MKFRARSVVWLVAILKTLALGVVLMVLTAIITGVIYGSGPVPGLAKWQIVGVAWLSTLSFFAIRCIQFIARPFNLEVLPEGVRVRDSHGERSWRWEGIKGVERVGPNKIRIIRKSDAGALPWYTFWTNYQRWQILSVSHYEVDAAEALVIIEEKLQALEGGIQSPYPRGRAGSLASPLAKTVAIPAEEPDPLTKGEF